jgi:hypothetical protein
MFGTDEFGNTRLLPIVFAVVFAALCLGTIATSQTMWEAPATAYSRAAL